MLVVIAPRSARDLDLEQLQDAGARTNVPMGSEGVRPYDLAAKTEKKSGLRDITRQRALQLPHSLDALA